LPPVSSAATVRGSAAERSAVLRTPPRCRSEYQERVSKPSREVIPANEGTAQRGERFIMRELALVANDEAPVLIEPRMRALDHPAVAPQGLTGIDPFACDARNNPSRATRRPAARDVVRLVRVQLRGPTAPVAGRGANRGDPIEHGFEGHGVVPVARPKDHGERDALPVGDQVALRARLPLVARVGAGSFRPFFTPFAGMPLESSAARLQSSFPAAPSRSSST
jgi:hypothetical protein